MHAVRGTDLFEVFSSQVENKSIRNNTCKTYANVLPEKSGLNIHANAYDKACVFLLRDTQAFSYYLQKADDQPAFVPSIFPVAEIKSLGIRGRSISERTVSFSFI
ncbi:hypothetical protein [uncultured Bacteroides sp.]|uniref:hypothetical protein n=1 Tax=uncultured Bacteroides sp. TaxID=162156 RepID=UPI003441E77C